MSSPVCFLNFGLGGNGRGTRSRGSKTYDETAQDGSCRYKLGVRGLGVCQTALYIWQTPPLFWRPSHSFTYILIAPEEMLFKALTAVALFCSAVTVRASPAPAALTDIAEFTGRATPLAQLITKCEVPNTVALTFDDGPEEYIYVCVLVLRPFLSSLLAMLIEYLKSADRCRCKRNILLEWQQL